MRGERIGFPCQHPQPSPDWKEFPGKDPEYVRWYPPRLEPLSAEEIGQSAGPDRDNNEIAFYIHVPFCVSLCKYCPFTRYEWQAEEVDLYVHSLLKEIELTPKMAALHKRPVAAGYLGGGTPTSLSTKQLATIMSHCRKHFSITPHAEMNIEANPDTVNKEKLKEILSLGFDRISFGVQTFDDSFLKRIGRNHTAAQARTAVELAHQVGFENICIDLIYKLPGQHLEMWEKDLQQAVHLGVHHISTYCLYIPPRTALYSELLAGRLMPQPDEQHEFNMLEIAADLLGNAGYIQQTVYDFALPGKDCKHHAINWQAPQGEYWGLGPGAFSHNRNYIYCNTAGIKGYTAALAQHKLPVALGKKISLPEQMSRFMVLGLKYMKVNKQKFREKFGQELDSVFAGPLHRLAEEGLIENHNDNITVTPLGKFHITTVCKGFYSEDSQRQPQPRAPK